MEAERNYGWKPDLEDERDLIYKVGATEHLPDSINLQCYMPEVYDQATIGSCTSQAIAGTIQSIQKREKLPLVMPSRLFIYYNERKMEGTINRDAGAYIRDGFKIIQSTGYPAEELWPYDVTKFMDEPGLDVYRMAAFHTGTYESVDQTSRAIEHCLASGFPITFGFKVYDNFEGDEIRSTGILGMPTGNLLGGHAVVCVGYDRTKQMFLVRNSWGADWGQKGYFWMPYAYMLDKNLCDSFWMFRSVD